MGGFWSSGLLVFVVLEVAIGIIAIVPRRFIGYKIIVKILEFCLCKVSKENL